MPAAGPDRTAWWIVLIATFAGASVAMQIGKVGVAMPLLRQEIPVGVAAASVYLSCISLAAALFGAMFGSFAFGIGVRRAALVGLALMIVAQPLGALAPGTFMLMAARIVEAVALPMVVTAMPAIVQAATGRGRGSITFGIWAGWLPLGIAMGMLLGFFVLEDLGWRGFYLLCAVPPMVALPLLFLVPADLPRLRKASSLGRARLPGLRNPVGQMALVYCMFSASYLTFAGFLPSVAVDDFGYSTREASMLAVWAALIIVPANVATAFACKHGFGRRRLLGISLIGMALFGAVFFNGDVLVQARVLSGIAFAICAGMAPAIFWESIPRLSDSSGMPAAIISGIFYQASGLGQLVGPILAGLAVDAAGAWYAAASAPILSGFVVTMLLIRHKYA
jgi:MFS family permease